MFTGRPRARHWSHEISHQWFGDAVTLNGGPTSGSTRASRPASEWIWSEHNGGATAQQTFDDLLRARRRPRRSGDRRRPTPARRRMFGGPLYNRGAMTLQALREKIGDDAFFRLLRDWSAQNRYGNVTTADFIALGRAGERAEADAFFDVWLYQPVKPTTW